MERCQQLLVYLPCYALTPRALLSSRSELRQQPTLPRSLPALPAAPGCWVLTTSPLPFVRSPPSPPAFPLTQDPLIGGGCGAPSQDAGCVHPAVPRPPPRLGRALPLSWMGCKQTPILTKSKLESCSLLSLSRRRVFREGRKFGIPPKTWYRSLLLPPAPQQAARSIRSLLAAPESAAQLVSLQLTRRTA